MYVKKFLNPSCFANIQNSTCLNHCATKDMKLLATYVKSTVILIDLQLFNATDEKDKEFPN